MKDNFDLARDKTKRFISKENIPHHMFYQPTTEDYWNQPLKMVAINLEPYGYEAHKEFYVDKNELIKWMFGVIQPGGKKNNTKTVRHTTAFLRVMRDGFKKASVPTIDSFREAYYDKEGLLRVLDEVCYYNIRTTSNYIKAERLSLSEAEAGTLSGCIADELKALDADFILISGHQPVAIVNKLLFPDKRLELRSVTAIGDQVVACVKHFSRPSYSGSLDIAMDAIPRLLKTKRDKSR